MSHPATTYTVQDRSGPGVIGFRAIPSDDTAPMEFVGIVDKPYFAMQVNGRWGTPSRVTAPERFGDWPTDDAGKAGRKMARAWVLAFLAAGSAS